MRYRVVVIRLMIIGLMIFSTQTNAGKIVVYQGILSYSDPGGNAIGYFKLSRSNNDDIHFAASYKSVKLVGYKDWWGLHKAIQKGAKVNVYLDDTGGDVRYWAIKIVRVKSKLHTNVASDDFIGISTHLSNTGYSQHDKARRLQAALKVQGFYTATIDGDFGPNSQAAMRLYQQANGLTPSGALFPEQELELVAASVQMLQQKHAQNNMSLTQGGIDSLTEPTPPLHYIDKGACPFECCTYREWIVAHETELLASHERNSNRVTTLHKGAIVNGITGIVKVEPGKIRVLKNDTSKISNINYKKGDILWVYTYLGEGVYNVWFNGKMYEEGIYIMDGYHSCQNTGDCWAEVLAKQKSVWWVKILNRNGIEGWSDKPENFDNKDACG